MRPTRRNGIALQIGLVAGVVGEVRAQKGSELKNVKATQMAGAERRGQIICSPIDPGSPAVAV